MTFLDMISGESGINREDLVKVILFRAPWLKGLNDDDDFLSERVLFPKKLRNQKYTANTGRATRIDE